MVGYLYWFSQKILQLLRRILRSNDNAFRPYHHHPNFCHLFSETNNICRIGSIIVLKSSKNCSICFEYFSISVLIVWVNTLIFSLIRETTGYAGGGIPQKSFSFKHRAKRATSKGTYKLVQRSNRRDSARLRAAEQSMQSKEYSVRL